MIYSRMQDGPRQFDPLNPKTWANGPQPGPVTITLSGHDARGLYGALDCVTNPGFDQDGAPVYTLRALADFMSLLGDAFEQALNEEV